MRWRHVNPIGILLWTLALCAIPAHGQIVSYRDSEGRRVFINADPIPATRTVKTSIRGFTPLGGAMSQGTHTSPELGVAELANRQKIEVMIREVSARYNVDPALIRAVIETESNWNSSAISRKGALGLMQLVPGTARQMGVNNAFDPRQNIDGGVRYLHTLLERYNGDLDRALAAYNAGPGAVDRARGIPQFRETREYVRKVTDSYFRPGSDRLSHGSRPIYQTISEDGRVVFTNE
jgi:soluble lytic murein transglycosylase-like protein